jgi:putative transposase
MQDYRTGRHCIFALHVHLVFVTKYRRNVLSALAIRDLAAIFGKVCEDFGAELVECNGADDHVHLLVEYPPQVSISKLVNSLKGVSSRRLRDMRPEVRGRYFKGVLWSPSYFAASCGGAPITILRQYVEQQREDAPPPRPKRRGIRRGRPLMRWSGSAAAR